MWSIVLASLATVAMAAVPADLDCTIPASNPVKIAPEGLACTDVMSPATCLAIFGGATASDASRETKCEAPADMKKLAIEQCPKYCGFCCKTPPYNCPNKPYAQTGLNCTTMADKCKDPTWRPLIAENCPSTCGMCMDSGCIDKAPDCASQQTICFNSNFQDWAKENCARTCNQCPAAGATTAAPTSGPGATNAPGATTVGTGNPPASCVDTDVNCANWARNGKFCNNTFYQAQWPKCRRSCGRC